MAKMKKSYENPQIRKVIFFNLADIITLSGGGSGGGTSGGGTIVPPISNGGDFKGDGY